MSLHSINLTCGVRVQTQVRRDVATQPVHVAGDAAGRERRGAGAARVQRAVRAAHGARRPADPLHQPPRAAAALPT